MLKFRLLVLLLPSLVCAGLATQSTVREPLIRSLETVIGEPPEKIPHQGGKSPQTYYTLDYSEPDPEMEKLVERQRMGFAITGEEQVLLNEYQMGGRVSGSNTLIRRIHPPILNWIESSIRVASGKRYTFIHCAPRASGPFPVALVLDPEIGAQSEVGMDEYHRMVRRLPVEAELPFQESYRGRYITHNSTGNQLISHAVSVIIPIGETLGKVDGISLEDWKSVMDFYTSKKYLDAESLFLVATREYAEPALRLAAHYPFTGLILEEPETGLFNTSLPASTDDSMKMAAVREAYAANLKYLQCPTLLVRHRKNPVIPANDAVLLSPLIERNFPLYLSMMEYPLRTLEELESPHKNDRTLTRYAYHFDSNEKLAKRLLHFIQQNGKSILSLLPEESNTPRMRNRGDSALAELERIEGRLQGFIQDPQNFNLNGDLSNDGSVTGGGFDETNGDLEQ